MLSAGQIAACHRDGHTDRPARDRAPDWSPDGTRIACTIGRGGGCEIIAMDSDGGKAVPLAPRLQDDGIPSPSPDGPGISCVAFETNFPPIYPMNVDVSSTVLLRDTLENDLSPAWFPLVVQRRR